jgi:hypothetical protein
MLESVIITDLLLVSSRGSIEPPPCRNIETLGLRVVAERPEG